MRCVTAKTALPAALAALLATACGGPMVPDDHAANANVGLPPVVSSARCLTCDPGDPGGGGGGGNYCTFTYGPWGACQANGTQTRTVLSKSPAGCTGTPTTTQGCAAPCVYTYSDWSVYSDWNACSPNGIQTRAVVSSWPAGCYGAPTTSQTCKNYDVGVIPGSAWCPASAAHPAAAAMVTIHTDDEDDTYCWYCNADAHFGWVGAITQFGDTDFRFCRVDGSRFLPVATTAQIAKQYAVLKLGTDCPNGSLDMVKRLDNEDRGHSSSTSGNAFPNFVDPYGDTHFHFCLFRHGPDALEDRQVVAGGPLFPDVGLTSYGVFAAPDFFYAADWQKGYVQTDDEDTNNGNAWEYLPPNLDLQSVYRIIGDNPPSGTYRNSVFNIANVYYQ